MRRGAIYRDAERLIPRVWRAERWWQRLRGLLFRPALAADGSEALLIVPCGSVHTVGMRYPLDIVFLDRAGTVVGCREAVVPWRGCLARGARETLELAAGAVARLAIVPGDRLAWRDDAVAGT